MSVLEQFALAWQCLRFAFRQLLSPSLWVPWLVVGVVESLVIVSLWWFAHPGFSWGMAPLLAATAGPEALRYPNVFRLLPALFARADLVIGATLGTLAAGASTALFAARAEGGPARPSAACRQALGRAVSLVLVNLPLTLIAVACSYGLDALLEARGSPASSRQLAHWASLGAVLLFQAWFLYANALVVLGGHGWIAALAALPRMASRGMLAAMFMTMITLVPVLGIQSFAAASRTLVDRGLPETVGWLMFVQVGVGLVSSFLLTGGAAVYYQGVFAQQGSGEKP